MDSIIGKGIFRAVVCTIACFGAFLLTHGTPIELKIMTLEGGPLQQAGVGVPFLAEVAVAGRDMAHRPHIGGLDKYSLKPSGVRVYSVNGAATTTYSYKVIIDRPGSYVIGPAVIELDGKQERSQALRINVGDKQVVDPAHAKAQATNEAFIKLSTDVPKVVVGQRVVCSLTFYGKRDTVKLEQVEEPRLASFTIGAKEGPITAAETIDGIEYARFTWRWHIYPKTAGRLVIPACGADFEIQNELNDHASFFSPFFRFNIEHKRLYSNACIIDVEELPPFRGPGSVAAVGTFRRIEASLKPNVATEGDGMVLRIDIEGDGNVAALETPVLGGMPAALKWYDSKQYINKAPGPHGLPVKSFEYIVQGLEPGVWSIPPQSFTFFDITERRYATLSSIAVPVTIKPGAQSRHRQQGAIQQKSVREENQRMPDNGLMPLSALSSWQPQRTRVPLPWSIFFVIAAFPVLWLFVRIGKTVMRSRARFFTRSRAFKHARALLERAARSGDAHGVYMIFIELFAHRLQCLPQEVSEDTMEHAFVRTGQSTEIIESWRRFYTDVYEYAFFVQRRDERASAAFFEQATTWVTLLEKIL